MKSIDTFACQEWSQIYHTTTRRCWNRANKQLASLYGSLIFLSVLVRVAFLTNMYIASDQASEARNVKYCYELHPRVKSS